MKIALAQLNYHIGDFEGNLAKITGAVSEATSKGAELVVFSELSICGYPLACHAPPLFDVSKDDQAVRGL